MASTRQEKPTFDTGPGASVTSRYHDYEEDVVGVRVDDLRDFKNASVEDFLQFVAGEFFAAGAFWLGVERIVTTDIWYKDALFWICAVALMSGLIIGYFGYKQLARRQTRIESIIQKATEGGKEWPKVNT